MSTLKFETGADLINSEPPPTGNWRVSSSRIEWTGANAGGYWIELETCRTCSEVLDWLLHVSGKTWVEPTDIGHLLNAMSIALPMHEMIQKER